MGPRRVSPRGPVVVVGAGVVGASVAYHLARLGVPVTVLDREPTPAAGVTGASFAWIGDASGDWPGGAEDLRGSVRADFRRLEADLPAVAVRWTGSLAWTGGRPGPGQAEVGADVVRALEPHLREPPARAVHTPGDGGVDPVVLTGALLEAARRLGARVELGSAVTSVRAGRVATGAGVHDASTVVLAAGTRTGALLGVPLPVASSPALLVRVAAPPGLVRTIVAGPHFEVREMRDGHLLMTAPVPGRLSRPALHRVAAGTVGRLRAAFRGAGSARLLGWRLGHRPMPTGGPLIGHLSEHPAAYVAVMHSAVTLAPTAGRLIAREIATGESAPEFARCRPER